MNHTTKSLIAGVVAVAGSAILLFAEGPVVNIDQTKHGNLWSAQKDIVAAYKKIGDAQKANSSRLGGHAEKARQLLIEAGEELKLAAEFANQR